MAYGIGVLVLERIVVIFLFHSWITEFADVWLVHSYISIGS